MKKIVTCTAIAFALIQSASASDEILQACIKVVEVEGQPEGVAGCECLADEVGDDEALTEELLILAETPPEERMLSDDAYSVVGKCFAVPDNTEVASLQE